MNILICTENPVIKKAVEEYMTVKGIEGKVSTLKDNGIGLGSKSLDKRDTQLPNPFQFTDTLLMKTMSILQDRNITNNFDYIMSVLEILVPDYLGGLPEYTSLRPSGIIEEMKDCEDIYRTAVRGFYISYCDNRKKISDNKNQSFPVYRTNVDVMGNVKKEISEDEKKETDTISLKDLSYECIFDIFDPYKDMLVNRFFSLLKPQD